MKKEVKLYYGATDVKPNTHLITFNTIDSVVDCTSIKIELLQSFEKENT